MTEALNTRAISRAMIPATGDSQNSEGISDIVASGHITDTFIGYYQGLRTNEEGAEAKTPSEDGQWILISSRYKKNRFSQRGVGTLPLICVIKSLGAT